jgi:zinc transporter ZupT
MEWKLYYSQYAAAVIAFYCVYFFGSKARAYHSGARLQTLVLAEYISRGIFFGIALLHFLPEAYTDLFPFLGAKSLYILIALGLVSFLFMLICEKGITHLIYVREKKSHHWFAYWILIVLSLHALIEGCALGLSPNYEHFLTLAIAILMHKGSEGFALGTVLGRYDFKLSSQKHLLIVLALASPIGIILASNLGFIIQQQHFALFEGYFNSLAAGTFLYIAICHSSTGCDHAGHASSYKRWLYYGLGVGLILLVSLVREF